MHFVSFLIATGFYSGYVPIAPGTAGSCVAVILYWLIPGSDSIYFLFILPILIWLGAWSATKVEKSTGKKDDQIIVIDEIVGVFFTLILMPKSWPWLILGCLLFRIFDITKPPPVKQAEAFPKGWGVMLDDVAAGIFSLISLRLIYWLWGFMS